MKTFKRSTMMVIALLFVATLTLGACAPSPSASSPQPAAAPSLAPTEMPAMAPTMEPTSRPTEAPTLPAQAQPTAPTSMPNMNPTPAQAPTTQPSANGAADLRVALTSLLREHVVLTSFATDAALGGRTDEFKAAANALDQNTVDLSKAIGSVYGPDAEQAFLKLWRAHIGFFVDYTQGLAKNDKAMKDKANQDLQGYVNDFATFISGANPNLPKDAVASLLKTHIQTLESVIDAQAAKDYAKAYTNERMAIAHMNTTADALAGGIAKQFPTKFAGDPDAKDVELRVGLDSLLREHVALASASTDAALGGRTDEFQAAAAALDQNTVDLSKAIGSVYGPDAEKAFLTTWRAHIGFFVDYTQADAAKDQAKKAKANQDLQGYIDSFSTFLANANPNITKDAAAGNLTTHIQTLESVIDAQAAKDWPTVYTNLRTAIAHMNSTGDTLSSAIVKQFPDKFK